MDATAAKPKWEYKVVEHDEIPGNGEFLAYLNQLGAEGWELATTCHICQPPYEKIRMVFKREKK